MRKALLYLLIFNITYMGVSQGKINIFPKMVRLESLYTVLRGEGEWECRLLNKDEWVLRIDRRYDSDKACQGVVSTSSLFCDQNQSSLVV